MHFDMEPEGESRAASCPGAAPLEVATALLHSLATGQHPVFRGFDIAFNLWFASRPHWLLEGASEERPFKFSLEARHAMEPNRSSLASRTSPSDWTQKP